MLAAQAISPYAKEVILLEKDGVCFGSRPGLPQSAHLHVLLARGREITERFFPGLDQELSAYGCPELDWGADTFWAHPSGTFPRKATAVKTRSVSRELLQNVLAVRIGKNPKIRPVLGARVTGLNFDAAGKKVVSVKTSRGEFWGDCFVDGLGRHSQFLSPAYLTESDSGASYVSVRLSGDLRLGSTRQINIQMRPGVDSYGAVWIPVENDESILTLVVRRGSPIPKDFSEIKSAIANLRDMQVSHALRELAPVSNLAYYARLGTARVRLREHAPNWIPIGDRVAILNPTYGQGMLAAALQVERLAQAFSDGRFPRKKEIFATIRKPFMFSRWEDLAQSGSRSMPLSRRAVMGAVRWAVASPFMHRQLLRQHHGYSFFHA